MSRMKTFLIATLSVLALFTILTFAVSQSIQQKKVAYAVQARCLEIAGLREEMTYQDPEYPKDATAFAHELNEGILGRLDLFSRCVTHDVVFSWYHPVNTYVTDAAVAKQVIEAHSAGLRDRLCGEEHPSYDFLKASFSPETEAVLVDPKEFLKRELGTPELEAELRATRSRWCEAHAAEKTP